MSGPRAALITGHYGVGKSTVLEGVAAILERAGVRYAALDLDWLAWAWTSDDEDHRAIVDWLGWLPPTERARES